ncbi:MAG: ribosome small subunit-dependent GTPase A [Deltaproteobacteria bacterium]|nr:ribosome small subunit-dependent GTPase A [Deltaproteobacteria bacterium]
MIDPVLAAWGLDARIVAAAGELSRRVAAPLHARSGTLLARVISEDRLGYELITARGELRAVLPGRMRRAAAAGEIDRPSVGDWIVVEDRPGVDGLPVLGVVPRRTKLSRKASGREAVEQIVGANVDVAFLVTALDGDFSARRLERYRAVCEEGGVKPVVVVTKIDRVADTADAVAEVHRALPGVPLVLVSNVTGAGLDALDAWLTPGLTVAALGSSGVGKSTLINRWIDAPQATRALDAHGLGRHTTTARALFRTAKGALLMDTPGMRELALWEADGGLRTTFAELEAVAARCKFRDCSHQGEPGCAIQAALDEGTIAGDRVDAWSKLRGELAGTDRRTRRAERTLSRAVRAVSKDKRR